MISLSMNTIFYDSKVKVAVEQLQQPTTRFDHLILASAIGSTSQYPALQLIEIAAGGLNALRYKLRTEDTRFALLRVQNRLLLVVSLAQNLSGLKRAQALVQGRAVQSVLGATIFSSVTILSPSQLTSALVGSKLHLDGFPHIASPEISQDFRASWSPTSTVSSVIRKKPSAPSSPEEIDLDARWSCPVSNFGLFDRHTDAHVIPTTSERAKSFHMLLHTVKPGDLDSSSRKGILIDLEPEVQAAANEVNRVTSRKSPVPPPISKLPPLPLQMDASTSSATAVATLLMNSALQRPIHLRKRYEASVRSETQASSSSLSYQELKHISDEKERIRVDEAIREEVMKMLRAEQQAGLGIDSRPTRCRIPRLVLGPPSVPPPPFSPPPAPLPHGTVVAPTVLLQSRQEAPSSEVKASSSRVSEAASARVSACTTEASLIDDPRTSESRESLRSSSTLR